MARICSVCNEEIRDGDMAMAVSGGKAIYFCSACFKKKHEDWKEKVAEVKGVKRENP
jgi:ribosomal protein L24E